MTEKIVTRHCGRSTWQGPEGQAPKTVRQDVDLLAWAVIRAGVVAVINRDRETAKHLCNPGEGVVRVAIRIVENEA